MKEAVCVIIPALNEEKSIQKVVRSTRPFVNDIAVVDDGSADQTLAKARIAGARGLKNQYSRGVHLAILSGIRSVTSDIIITLDADGQHPPEFIPRLLKPIIEERADFVIGRRHRPQPSEKIIRKVVQSITSSSKELDVGCGFRAFRRAFLSEARPEDLGYCGCGSIVLFAMRNGARIAEVPFEYQSRIFGRSRFAKTNKNELHRRQAHFLMERYGSGLPSRP